MLRSLTLAYVLGSPLLSDAADPRFLGNLALLVEEPVAQQLELSTEQRSQVRSLVKRREAAALELAIAARQLSPTERQQRLAEFVESSEQMARQLLKPAQQQLLVQCQLSRNGLASLSQDEVADQLALDASQRQQLQRLLDERAGELADADESQQAVVRAVYERRLEQLLTPSQRGRWEQMCGGQPSTSTPPTEEDSSTGSPVAATEPTAPPTSTDDALAGPSSAAPAATSGADDGLLYFNFRYAPWKDVLDWFATKADLSLVLEAPPPGTFNYSDSKGYTPAETMDLLNSVLLTKGYTLVRRERMLLVINLEDGIPPNLVTTISVDELEQRGTFELVRCRFPLGNTDPAIVEEELSKLIGPQGDIQVLSQARQVVVTETAGRLRTVRDVLRSMEDPMANGTAQIRAVLLEYINLEDAFTVIREMLGLPEDLNAAPDGSLRMAGDPSGQKIMLTGSPDSVARVTEILQLIDVPSSRALAGGGLQATPQLEVYSVPDADSESALQVLQTLLADEPSVRLATDPQTGNLVALGLPSHHATIQATLQQLQRDAQQVEVLRLRMIDPQVAVLSINKLFGSGEEGNRLAPRVDADITTGQLLIRGTRPQIDQIRSLLEKMGETNTEAGLANQQDRRLRVVPMTGAQAEAVLEQAQQIWPTLRENRIRTVTPSATMRAVEPRLRETLPATPPADSPSEDNSAPAADGDLPESSEQINTVPETAPLANAPPHLSAGALTHPLLGSLVLPTAAGRSLVQPPLWGALGDLDRFGSSADDDPLVSASLQVAQADRLPAAKEENANDSATVGDGDSSSTSAEIIVSPSPAGLLIACQDLEVLNDFEELLLTLANRQGNAARQFAIFYLRYSTAEATASLLNDVLSGGGGSGEDGGSGGLLTSLAGAALGDAGGGLVGSLLGLAGDASSFRLSGSFLIIPEPRLNFLIVRASPADMEVIEALLELIDQQRSPEDVETIAAPRLIPVFHTSAESIAGIVRQVYANRLASGPGQNRQPTPEEFLRALRGGGQGGGDSSALVKEQRQMTIGVDNRSNSLVVSAPESLFQEVSALVEQLDQVESGVMETTRVITLKRVNPDLVRQAVSAVIGQPVGQNVAATPGSPTTSPAPPTPPARSAPSQPDGEAIRRRIEFFRALQQGIPRPNSSPEAGRRPGRRSPGR